MTLRSTCTWLCCITRQNVFTRIPDKKIRPEVLSLIFLPGIACLVITSGALLLRSDTWYRPFLGTCICSDCWDQFPKSTKFWPWYRTWPSPNCEWFPRNVSEGVASMIAYPSGHLVPYLCSNCWDQFSRTCLICSRLFTLNNPRYILDFAKYQFYEKYNLLPNVRPQSIYLESQVIAITSLSRLKPLGFEEQRWCSC